MSKIIDILIAIDTDAVLANNPNPSKDPDSPTGIAHNMGFMVCTGTTIVSGQGTGDLNFNALVGDTVRVFGVSGSDNFEASVLVYSLPKFGGTPVLDDFEYKNFNNKSSVVPQSTSTPLPARIVPESFWFYQADVNNPGTENYMVQFALYGRDPNTGQPTLVGYYAWDPTITVAG
jgi:hypothetical protein